jgi:hypothetical protein
MVTNNLITFPAYPVRQTVGDKPHRLQDEDKLGTDDNLFS